MTIRHMRIYIEVCRQMSITAAASKLHLAQPAVSVSIRELEEHYHVRLFDRIGRKIYITEEGKRFYDYALHIIDMFDELEENMLLTQNEGTIHIGSSVTIGKVILPQAIRSFSEQYPRCRIHAEVQNSQQICSRVLKNELDIGIIEDRIDNDLIRQIPLEQDPLIFVCSSRHPLAHAFGKSAHSTVPRSSYKELSPDPVSPDQARRLSSANNADQEPDILTLQQICTYPFLLRERGSASREITEALLQSCHLSCTILMESISNSALIEMAKQTQGIAVLPKRLVFEDIKNGQLSMLPCFPQAFERDFAVIYHKNKHLNILHQNMIRILQSCAENNKNT